MFGHTGYRVRDTITGAIVYCILIVLDLQIMNAMRTTHQNVEILELDLLVENVSVSPEHPCQISKIVETPLPHLFLAWVTFGLV